MIYVFKLISNKSGRVAEYRPASLSHCFAHEIIVFACPKTSTHRHQHIYTGLSVLTKMCLAYNTAAFLSIRRLCSRVCNFVKPSAVYNGQIIHRFIGNELMFDDILLAPYIRAQDFDVHKLDSVKHGLHVVNTRMFIRFASVNYPFCLKG